MAAALINVPAKAKRGEVIEIKTLMSHIMETGFRHTASGEVVPRDIITSFTCRYNGEEIFRADLFPAIAANPFITFFTIATESGKFEFEWIGDNGFSRNRVRLDHRRMRICRPHRDGGAADRRRCRFAAEIPQAERRSGYSFMAPDTKAMQDDDTANPGMLWVLDGEALWKRKAGAAGQGLRRLPQRRARQHEGRRRPLSRLRQGARPPGRSRTAHQSVPRQSPAGGAACLRKPRPAGADRLRRAAVARHRRSRPATIRS